MTTRAEIVAEARSWVGTPWHHMAHLKGVGCDCIGFLRGVATARGIVDKDVSRWPNVQRFLRYTGAPDGKLLREACETYLTPITKADMQIGDVILVSVNEHPQHLGILGDYRYGGFTIIHATNDSRLMRVVEMRLMFSKHFRFDSAFRFPGVA